jgi:diguanylate cyclase (GGDEF)-like protein
LLEKLDILDTDPEEVFDRMVRIAVAITGVPTALVSLVDTDRQWFKAREGLDAPQTSREVSFCGHAVLSDRPFVVPDARVDPRFCDNPIVVGGPRIVFYYGVPLALAGDVRVGTLCVIDYQPRELTPAQQHALADLGQMVVRELELRNAALTDPLTGASNRRLLLVMGNREMARTQRNGQPMAAVTFDLDHFKRINDTWGHETGDRFLRAVAQACRDALRIPDMLFRQGGDEFTVLMVEVALEDALLVADRLRAAFAALLVDTATGPVQITASFGVAGFSGGEESLDGLLARADAALYTAKFRGRNCIEVALPV